MLESLKKEMPHLEILEALQDSLQAEIMSKKSLLMLDDIWEDDEKKDKSKWEVLVPLTYGSLESKILVTTRTNSVALIFAKEGHFSTPSDIARAIVTHFKNLYNPVPSSSRYHQYFAAIGNSIPTHLLGSVIAYVTDLEIKQVVFSGPTSSSSGPDGFTFEFFKTSWEVIGLYVTNAVKTFSMWGTFPDILANRLKSVMPFIIHKSQDGFISKRISTDNIILANEVLNCFNAVPNKKFFCAKLDIRKAFDSVSWEFLFYRLKVKGFPDKFLSWIKSCVNEVPFSVCVNGALEGFFTSSASLRQGCPLSPLLFAIVMDAFSCSLDVRNLNCFPCGPFSLNHLLYADDVLVFGEASTQNAWEFHKFLMDFAYASGLHTNNAKCSILFSTNTSLANDIAHILGRIKFLRFTIANTLAYWIRGSIIPKTCIKLIDRLCARFLYHGTTVGKKLHLVAWKNTYLPTCFRESSILALGNPPQLKLPNSGISSSNCNLSFFWDPWLGGKCVADFFPPLLGWPDSFRFYLQGGVWCLPDFIPRDVQDLISGIPLTDDNTTPLSWKSRINNKTSFFKAFRLNFYKGIPEVSWAKYIWHKRAALRFSSYSWLLIKNGLKTADVLAKRHIYIDPMCPICLRELECSSHLFFLCDFSFDVLAGLLPILNCFLLRPSLLQLFEFMDEISIFNAVEKNFCYFVVCCVIYFLWRERNDRRFSGTNMTLPEMLKKITWAISLKVYNWKSSEALRATFPTCFNGNVDSLGITGQ
ncbi:uncharacterized protein LOC110098065 [Dendrobium catenatum]|uniref:uncharacterized protein LOC110098065 n=1 Tax=Dendrobium catenatum TaxID=906689 RepID=UPI0010A0AFD3|nr:uncharacterized protein LOC110098065 [Dendrobium catenatum]